MEHGSSLSGWLQKLEARRGVGKGKGHYRKCWFVLSHEAGAWTLSHYEHGTHMREFVGAERLAQGDRQQVLVKDITNVQYKGSKGNKFEIEVLGSVEPLKLRAVNEDVCQRWVEALINVMNISPPKRKPSGTASSGKQYTDYSLKKGFMDKRRERESMKVTTAFLQDSEIFMSSAKKFTLDIASGKSRKTDRRKGRGRFMSGLGDPSSVEGFLPPPPPSLDDVEPPIHMEGGGGQEEDTEGEEGGGEEGGEGEGEGEHTGKHKHHLKGLAKRIFKKDKRSVAHSTSELPSQTNFLDYSNSHAVPPPPPRRKAPSDPLVGEEKGENRKSAPRVPKGQQKETQKVQAEAMGKGKPGRSRGLRASLSFKKLHNNTRLDRPKAATIVSARELKSKKSLGVVRLAPKAFSGAVAQERPAIGRRLAVLPDMRQNKTSGNFVDIKSDSTKLLLKEIIDASLSLSGMLFNDLDRYSMNELVDRMYRVDVKAQEDVIRQGKTGDTFYVISEGRFHFYRSRGGEHDLPELVAENGPRTFFGELALLYEQPSPVTVRAVTDGVLWAISRSMFFEIRKAQARKRQGRKLRLLSNMDILSDNLDESDVFALAEAMEELLYDEVGTLVIEDGARVDKVLIIGSGSCDVIVNNSKVGELRAGDSFGEWALLEKASKADVKLVVGSPETTILSLDVEEFEGLVGSLRNVIKDRWAESVGEMFPARRTSKKSLSLGHNNTSDPAQVNEIVHKTIKTIKEDFSRRKSSYLSMPDSVPSTTSSVLSEEKELVKLMRSGKTQHNSRDVQRKQDRDWEIVQLTVQDVDMTDLEPLELLGKGSFGRVHLVRKEPGADKRLPPFMALKVLSREYIQSHGWTEMVENERNAMAELCMLTDCPFVVQLYSCFADKRNVYFLMELLDGGDLYGQLRRLDEPRISENWARFYIAGVVRALAAIHSRGILYRDLKPENIFLGSDGYPRVADFGLAKKALKTYTVCGTPDYMSPEIILGRGHDSAADTWAVGVLIFEICTGVTPFCGREPMDIYESVLAHRDGLLEIPDFAPLSKSCRALMGKLLSPKTTRRQAVVRRGYNRDPWFEGFDWAKLDSKTLSPPLEVPVHDVSIYKDPEYYNLYDPLLDVGPIDNSGWEPFDSIPSP